jgi:hypothetical protein
VFKGMMRLLEHKPKIIFENNPLAKKECGYSSIDIWENFIQVKGYDAYYLNSKKNSTFLSFYKVNKTLLDKNNIDEFKGLAGDIFCV